MAKKPQYDPEEIRYPDQKIVESPLVPEMEKSYIEYAMSIVMKKDLGTAKNLLDFIFVALAAAIDLLFHGTLVSVGIGTVIAMVLMGRVIYVFNHFFKARLLKLAGLA